MNILEINLGKALNAQQVAKYMGLDVKTVRKFYRDFGGIRVGSRYLFFEKEIYNAVQKGKELDSCKTPYYKGNKVYEIFRID